MNGVQAAAGGVFVGETNEVSAVEGRSKDMSIYLFYRIDFRMRNPIFFLRYIIYNTCTIDLAWKYSVLDECIVYVVYNTVRLRVYG